MSNTTVPKNIWRKLRHEFPHEKHFNSYPAVKIGRLAVAQGHQGEHIGSMLIRSIREMLLRRASIGACRFITVDAITAKRPFYEGNGFRLLINEKEIPADADTVPMYFDLKAFLEKN